MPHFLQPLVVAYGADGADHTPHILLNTRTGRAVATTLEPAFDSAQRRKGLLGRTGLAVGTALIIAPCSSIHTWFMRFPIDVIFVDRDGRVRKVGRRIGPWRLAMSVGAFATIELAKDGVGDVLPGDVLRVCPRET